MSNETIRIFAFYKKSKENIKTKVERDLLWYDHIKRKMLTFKGGRLVFSYKLDEELGRNRMLPEVEDDFAIQPIIKIDKNSIHSLLENYDNVSLLESNNDGCVFEIPYKEKEDFTYELERNNINYSII